MSTTVDDPAAVHDDEHGMPETQIHDTEDPFDNPPAEPLAPTVPQSAPPTQVDVPPAQPQRPQQREREGPVDPRVVALRAMFPDFDDGVLQSVLESVRGDQDRAVDLLLGLSDPEYMSDVRPEPPAPTQTELDEQLARQLMLQDEEEQQHAWQAQQQRPQRPAGQQEARQNRTLQSDTRPPGDRDTIAEFTEQFNKVAEAGKKTFGSLFNKVKAKMQEFDQPSSRAGQGSSSGTEPRWGSGPAGTYDYTEQQAPPSANRLPSFQLQQQPPQPSTYSPTPLPAPPSPSLPAQGYDASPPQTAPPTVNNSTYPAPSDLPPSAAPQTSSLAAETPRPPQTGSGTPINAGKFGLLPKKPVSLLREQPTQHAASHDDDDDDLEYTENPFDDHRR